MQHTTKENRSVLASLRSLIPDRRMSITEAHRIAELQANRFLSLFGIATLPVPNEIVTDLPHIRVVHKDLPVSGASVWSTERKLWIITLNKSDAWVRQRFTLMHEFKHIIDHGRAHLLYTGNDRHTATEQAELIADYFAGCVLMPKRSLKAAWTSGIQTSARLAREFDVSTLAMEVRLSQTRLNAKHDGGCQLSPQTLTHGRQRIYQRPLAIEGAC